MRLRSCKDRISDLLAGRIQRIEELEVKQEVFVEDAVGKAINFNHFGMTYTACGH